MSYRSLFRFCLLLLAGIGLCGGLWLFGRPLLNEGGPIAPANAAMLSSPPEHSSPLATLDPEAQLLNIIAAIEKNQLTSALEQTETLLQHYPNYRLGYLIKGDLLLARANLLPGFGAVSDAFPEQVDDLRAEAIARLKAYRQKPSENTVPRYLLQMNPQQKHAIVVDTENSRLYLYRNEDGSPRFVADYYVTQGKLGANKKVEGDRRTPLGVYHVTSHISQEKLVDMYGRIADLYGHGAFPINYPNELDRLQKRTGSGIWLHGTPSDTYSRPPQASDGCVVLANPDLDQLGQSIDVGYTPVIISNGIEWAELSAWQNERDELKNTIDAWKNDWESLDSERYLAHYSPLFKTRRQTFAEFAAQKRQVNQGKTWVKVKISDLSIFRNPVMPDQEEVVVVTFRQDYASNNLVNSMKKRQYWRLDEGRWRIFYEGEA